MSAFELVTVPAGARSLRSLEHGETFHPGIGPMAEARLLHAAQHDLASRAGSGGIVVWDVGLGAGANAVAVLEAARDSALRIEMHSFDLTFAPLRFALEHAAELEYPLPWLEPLGEIAAGRPASVGALTWHPHLGDFAGTLAAAPAPQAVIFDPYSPASNPGMWTAEIFAAILGRADPARACTLSSYSRSTVTRVNLLRAGWFVGRGIATGEKTETTVAASHLAALRDPLRRDWLERVRRSTALEGEAVVRELEGHPQFLSGGGFDE